MFNPRFPHTLSIKRAVVDSSGMPVCDYDGTATYEQLELVKPVYFDGNVVRDDMGEICTEIVSEIEFGHRTNSMNTSTNGDVVVAQYVLHTPLLMTELKYGDIAVITDNDGTWEGTIVGKKNFNWGSNIFVNNVEN